MLTVSLRSPNPVAAPRSPTSPDWTNSVVDLRLNISNEKENCATPPATPLASPPRPPKSPTQDPTKPRAATGGMTKKSSEVFKMDKDLEVVSRGKLITGHIPGVSKEASRLIYGTLFLHTLPTDADAFDLLDCVFATGCNTFDCAAIYGGGVCEARMGRWLHARQMCDGKGREDIVVITKGGCEGQDKLWASTIADHATLRSELERSLKRLGVKYIDLYLLHRDDPSVPVEGVVNFMSSLVDEGLIRAWGVSNWQLPRLAAALEYAHGAGKHAPAADSPQNSLAAPTRAVWPNTTFLSAESRPAWQEATRGEVAMLGWECLAKGFMCGKWRRADGDSIRDIELNEKNGDEWRDMQLRQAYCDGPLNFDRRDRAEKLAGHKSVDLPAMALGYVVSQSPRSFALVGTTSKKHFIQNVKAVALSSPVAAMTREELSFLESGTPLSFL